MILYPAIDLKDGRCVRLLHGDLNKETVFNNSPADQAEVFQKQGFSWLHVVDLNGAVEGTEWAGKSIEEIVANLGSLPAVALIACALFWLASVRRRAAAVAA